MTCMFVGREAVLGPVVPLACQIEMESKARERSRGVDPSLSITVDRGNRVELLPSGR
jgi:hypothetical protein